MPRHSKTNALAALLLAAGLSFPAFAGKDGPKPLRGEPIDALPAAEAKSLPAQPPPPGYGKPQTGPWQDCDNVRRRITVLNPDVVQGDIVRIRLELEGIGTDRSPEAEPAEFAGRLVFGVDLLATVAGPNIPAFNYVPLNTGELVPNTIYRLRPGETIRIDREMIMDSESISGALFETVGLWRFNLVLGCPDAEKKNVIPLNMGTFQVNVAPASGDDATAFRILSADPATYRVLASLTGAKPDQVARIREAVEKAPGARIRPHLLAALSILSAPDPKNPGPGIPYLDTILREYPNHPVWEDAALRMLEVNSVHGNLDAARPIFDRVWQNPVLMTRLPVSSKLATFFTGGDYRKWPTDAEWFLRPDPAE